MCYQMRRALDLNETTGFHYTFCVYTTVYCSESELGSLIGSSGYHNYYYTTLIIIQKYSACAWLNFRNTHTTEITMFIINKENAAQQGISTTDCTN